MRQSDEVNLNDALGAVCALLVREIGLLRYGPKRRGFFFMVTGIFQCMGNPVADRPGRVAGLGACPMYSERSEDAEMRHMTRLDLLKGVHP